MASNSKNPLKGVHTAGIFADMTIDGPVIGTLILVVDRAKNLPNRKTIGKQDPYCAARLGKEAKKTNTDIRGGQTPKWDQELRFKVHDSPDYFQLKVSCFSDDKKTELIGETWIDLREIIVPGGGQSDQWHSLSCRGKYAGEIRLETTYYDSRPPEKPPVAVAPPPVMSSASMSGSARGRQGIDSVAGGSGTFGPRGPAPKRRPLPSDPVTGQPPPAQPQPRPPSPPPQAVPLQGPEVGRTPPRPQPNPPSVYSAHTSTRLPLPPVGYTSTSTPPQPALYQQQQQPPQMQQPQQASMLAGRYLTTQEVDLYPTTGPGAGFDGIPAAQHHHDRHQSHHSHHNHSRDRSQYGNSELPPDFTDVASFQDRQQLSYDQPRDVQEAYFNPAAAPGPTPAAMAPFYEDPNLPAVGDRPPPPPVHRNRNNSTSACAADAMYRNSPETSPQKGSPLPTMRRDVLRNEAQRHSMSSAYPGRPTYRPVEPTPPAAHPANGPAYNDPSLEPPMYDGGAPAHDEVPSPAPLNIAGNRSIFSASPVPVHSSSTPSHNRYGESNGVADRTSPSPMDSRDFRRASTSPQPGLGSASYDTAHGPASMSYQYSLRRTDGAMYAPDSDMYIPPSVPASLVPGVDPLHALELRSRSHQEERYSGHQQQQERPDGRYSMPAQSMTGMSAQATPPRGRQMPGGEAWSGYSQDSSSQVYTPQRQQTYAAQAYNTPPPAQAQRQDSYQRYDRSPGPYSSGVPSPVAGTTVRGVSPNPQHTIRRKSVSPAPSPLEGGSDMPFGPDSFNSLNPSLAKTLEEQVRPDYNEASGKIVMHDGREVDPSDHLPVETWAPEPEPKPPKAESPAAASPRDYSTPTSGRKQLRVAGHAQASTASSGITFSSADGANTFTPTTRNRLQKKANRQSPATVPVSNGGSVSTTGSPQGPIPRAPLTHSRQQQTNCTPPRTMARASTFDYPNENHAPAYYGNGSPGRVSIGKGSVGPPLPAKIAMNGGSDGTDSYRGSGSYRASIGGGYQNGGDRSPVMSGALPAPSSPARVLPWDSGPVAGRETGTGSGLSLVEEMSRIDIGTGRARRHQGQYY